MKKRAEIQAGQAAFVASLALIGAPAWAQSQEAGGSEGNRAGREVVIVTAQKRAEDVQDVPLSVVAVGGGDLEVRRVDEVSELANIDPSVSFRQSVTPATSGFKVRGVGAGTFATGLEQSVSTIVDGIVLSDPSSVQTLLDVDRVEVLRGPQGMLFGKNASAGVVNIITRNPGFDSVSGRLSMSVGSRDEQKVTGALNVPLSDTVAVRLAAGHQHRGEILTNAVTGLPVDELDREYYQAKLLWEPSNDLSVLVGGAYAFTDSFASTLVWRDVTPGSIVDYSLDLYGVEPGPNNTTSVTDFQPYGKQKSYRGFVEANYDLNGYTLTSISGATESHVVSLYDGDQMAFDFISFNGGLQDYRNISQEFRVDVPVHWPIRLTAGAYYYESWLKGDIRQAGFFQNFAVGAPQIPSPQTTYRSSSSIQRVNAKSIAAFTQGEYDLTDTITILAGARYTDDEAFLIYTTAPFIPGTPPISGNPPFFSQGNSADNVSWKVGAKYEPTSELMFYGTVSTGYKGPGFSGLSFASTGGDQRVAPETSTSFELGVRSEFWNGLGLANLTLFNTNYEDYQAQVADVSAPVFRSIITNAGELRTRGAEGQVSLSPVDGLDLGLLVSYIDAEYQDFPGVGCYPGQALPECSLPTRSFNADGLPLEGAPKWSYTASAAYTTEQLFAGYETTFSSAWAWRDDVNFSTNQFPLTAQEAYGLLDLDIRIAPIDGTWAFSLYGRNVLDERWAAHIAGAPVQSSNPSGTYQAFSPNSFMTWGGELSINF